MGVRVSVQNIKAGVCIVANNIKAAVFPFVKETPAYNVFEAPEGSGILGKLYVEKVDGADKPKSVTVAIQPNA